MCGIAVVLGPCPDPAVFRRMLNAVAPRGEVEEVHYGHNVLARTQRLRIVDRDTAVQPWRSPDGEWLLCYNGELYNHQQLRAELPVGRGGGDTEVVLAAFLTWGADAVTRLRGEFAFVIVHSGSGRAYVARDPLGVKPLYLSRAAGQVHLASEIKALVATGAPIHEVPPGHHGWVDPVFSRLQPYHRLTSSDLMVEDPDEAVKLVRSSIEDSVRVRVDTDLPVGVILSGGLDSSVTLALVRRYHPDCVAFTIGTPHSEDLTYARRLTRRLGVPHEVIELRPRDIGPAAIREAVRLCELTEYGDTINAVVSVPLFRRVRACGVKVVLTGDGSDELFGGYPMYDDVDSGQSRRLFAHMVANLHRTELQRVDRASLGQGVEARVPFLDPAVVDVALRLPMAVKVRDGQTKWVVREAFADLLPDEIRHRPKNPMSYSTGLHDRARLFKPLFPRLHRSFGYDRHQPVRRDFDRALADCDYDLDRGLDEANLRRDYRPGERLRDLAGAVRWNLPAPWRPRG